MVRLQVIENDRGDFAVINLGFQALEEFITKVLFNGINYRDTLLALDQVGGCRDS